MNREFAPYEQSLALKELGFDEKCFSFYDSDGKLYESEGYYKKGYNVSDEEVIAPLYQQAFRWFREKHNLMFQIFYLRNGNHAVIIHKTTPEYMDLVDQLRLSSGCVAEVPDCYSYEEAELACLIKLIEIVKNKKPDV